MDLQLFALNGRGMTEENRMGIRIKDRTSAGRDLAQLLLKYRKRHGVRVLGVPRGGVPVAAEIARVLHAPLDVLVVRKLGAPQFEELAIGAIASGGVRVLNEDVIAALGVSDTTIERLSAREETELERRMKAYRADRPWPDLEGQYVVLVDDGSATGAMMDAAVSALRKQGAVAIAVAVPVASFESLTHLRREVDEVVCLATPSPFGAVAAWYESFPHISDREVRTLLGARWAEQDPTAGMLPQLRTHAANQE